MPIIKRDLFKTILAGKLDEESTTDIDEADYWVDESIEQIELGEEPTLWQWLNEDHYATIAYRATLAAIHQIYVDELTQGNPILEATKRIEPLVFRLAATFAHKIAVASRDNNQQIKM